MRVEEAEILARALMDKHGLRHWHLVWAEWNVLAGRCYRELSSIAISRPVVECNDIGMVREIVLHEIAHALTTGGHDDAWKAMARRIGSVGVEKMTMVLPERSNEQRYGELVLTNMNAFWGVPSLQFEFKRQILQEIELLFPEKGLVF